MTKVTWTCMNVINFVTFIALKVVMVFMAGDFKSWVVTRQAHLCQDCFFHQGFNVPVDGRNAHAWDLGLSSVQHLLC